MNDFKKKKILLNLTTLNKGGALQVGVDVLKHALQNKNNDIDWSFAVSLEIFNQLEVSNNGGNFFVFDKSPAKSYFSRKKIKKLANNLKVDAVFTLFGPAYVKFPMCHVCGIADGWVTHADKLAYSSLPNIFAKIKMYLHSKYKLHWYKKSSYWFVESNIAKIGFLNKTQFPENRIFCFPNAVSNEFFEYLDSNVSRKVPRIFKILVFGAAYPHKNLTILPDVIVKLLSKGITNFQFYFTVDNKSHEWRKLKKQLSKNRHLQYIENLGPIAINDAPQLYLNHDILFFPSKLETFSATPLEAIYMNMPLAVSNIGANIAVCEDAPDYFNPTKSAEAAESLIKIMKNYNNFTKKVDKLKTKYRLSGYNAESRFIGYRNKLLELLGNKNV